MIELSLSDARRLALTAQLLDGGAPASVTDVVRVGRREPRPWTKALRA